MISVNQEAGLAMGAITQTSMREKVVDFSYPYFFTRVGFFTRKPSQIPNYKAIIGPYNIMVWMALSASVPVFTLIYLAYSKIDKEGFNPSFNFDKALMQVSQMLVMQGIYMLKDKHQIVMEN